MTFNSIAAEVLVAARKPSKLEDGVRIPAAALWKKKKSQSNALAVELKIER